MSNKPTPEIPAEDLKEIQTNALAYIREKHYSNNHLGTYMTGARDGYSRAHSSQAAGQPHWVKALLEMAEDGYKRSEYNGAHSEFLSEDRKVLQEARDFFESYQAYLPSTHTVEPAVETEKKIEIECECQIYHGEANLEECQHWTSGGCSRRKPSPSIQQEVDRKRVRCCDNCRYLSVDSSPDQTGPSIWCSKDHFEGVRSQEEANMLLQPTDCKDFAFPSPEQPKGEALKGPWRLEAHSHQIADTGDYDGYYELTDGKISIFTKDDTEDGYLEKVVETLNETGCKFYLDDSNEFLYYHEKQRADELQVQLSAKQQQIEDGNDAYALLEERISSERAEHQVKIDSHGRVITKLMREIEAAEAEKGDYRDALERIQTANPEESWAFQMAEDVLVKYSSSPTPVPPVVDGEKDLILSIIRWTVDNHVTRIGRYYGKDYSNLAYDEKEIVQEFLKHKSTINE